MNVFRIAVTCALLVAVQSVVSAATGIAVPIQAPPPLNPFEAPTTWSAVPLSLAWDVRHNRPATEPTSVRIMGDGRNLYLRFDATQVRGVTASVRTNDVGQGLDDEVRVDLWPSGESGFFYQFVSTPLGTHYQTSSENTTYAPIWQSRGSVRDKGYTVTMAIPLSAIRSAKGSRSWRMQLVRYIHATGEEQIWTYDPAQRAAEEMVYSGEMDLARSASAPRLRPRVAVYGLEGVTSPTASSAGSRIGADASVPLTGTSSFYATFHPDYSNVELDQQTISPSVYQRFYSEVRPFFTQGSSFFNNAQCRACPTMAELYTPAIPTPRDGYAIEGKQGRFGFVAFDAVGDTRTDGAMVLDYTDSSSRWTGTFQSVAANAAVLHDEVLTSGVAYSDLKHVTTSLAYGVDHGTNVVDPASASRLNASLKWSSPTYVFAGSVLKVGDYYNPVDGYVQHPGIAGYTLYTNKIWLLGGGSKLAAVAVGGFLDRFVGVTGGSNQSDNAFNLNLLTRSAIDLNISMGSNFLRGADGRLIPLGQNGVGLTYHSGSDNDPSSFDNHGSSATPTSIGYSTGLYGGGRLDTWYRSTTVRVGDRGTLTAEFDDTLQRGPALDNVQWFERVGYVLQLDATSSLALGLRRVIGTPVTPNGGGVCTGRCSNVSFAFHKRFSRSELYAVYGDPNGLSTVPQALVKLILYAGAEKGDVKVALLIEIW